MSQEAGRSDGDWQKAEVLTNAPRKSLACGKATMQQRTDKNRFEQKGDGSYQQGRGTSTTVAQLQFAADGLFDRGDENTTIGIK